MSIGDLKYFLLWSTAINYAVLIVWFVVFVYARDWLYRAHSRWFKFPTETFDALNYAGIAVYKIGILLLNVVPLIALYLAS